MARLPQVGGDSYTWGKILNEYLSVEHNSNGTLKSTGSLASKYTKPATGIPRADLAANVQASLDNADAAIAGTAPDATTTSRGVIRLAGDLTGTALVPQIGAGRVTGGVGGHIETGAIINANIHSAAGIDKSKLAPLAIDNNDIATGAAITQNKIQNLISDLAGKAASSHNHAIVDIANLQAALDNKAANSHTHEISNVIGLQATLDAKAASSHTHSTGQIIGLDAAVGDVIHNKLIAGSNVTVNYDAESGETVINASGGGSGEPSESVMTVAGRTGDVVLVAGDITDGAFATGRIPNLSADKITSDTLSIDRLPTGTSGATVALGNHTHGGTYAPVAHTHAADDISSGTFNINRIPTGTSSATVALGNHRHDSDYAALTHTHDDRYYTETEVNAALGAKLNASEKGAANGVATLGADSKIPTAQLPALAINETFTVASQSAMLALSAERGDMAIRTDNGKTYVLAADAPSTLANWKEVMAAGQVASVNGQTGVINITAAGIGGLVSNPTPFAGATQITNIVAITQSNYDALTGSEAGYATTAFYIVEA